MRTWYGWKVDGDRRYDFYPTQRIAESKHLTIFIHNCSVPVRFFMHKAVIVCCCPCWLMSCGLCYFVRFTSSVFIFSCIFFHLWFTLFLAFVYVFHILFTPFNFTFSIFKLWSTRFNLISFIYNLQIFRKYRVTDRKKTINTKVTARHTDLQVGESTPCCGCGTIYHMQAWECSDWNGIERIWPVRRWRYTMKRVA